MATAWWRIRHGEHLIKITGKYNNGKDKVFYDEIGRVYYTHKSIKINLPFWIDRIDSSKNIYGAPNYYFKPRVYYLPPSESYSKNWVNRLKFREF